MVLSRPVPHHAGDDKRRPYARCPTLLNCRDGNRSGPLVRLVPVVSDTNVDD